MAAHANAPKTILRPMVMMPSFADTPLPPTYAETARVVILRTLSVPVGAGDDAPVVKPADLGR